MYMDALSNTTTRQDFNMSQSSAGVYPVGMICVFCMDIDLALFAMHVLLCPMPVTNNNLYLTPTAHMPQVALGCTPTFGLVCASVHDS